jgi:hypothetical protein
MVVGIAAMFSLGGNLNNLLGQTHERLIPQKAPGQDSIHNLAGLLGQKPAVANAAFQEVQLRLSDGTVISLEQYPKETSDLVQVASSDGTEVLLANLRSLTRQLREKGKITEAQANQLSSLANRGHALANLERQFEQAAKKSGNSKEKFAATRIPYQGKVYSPTELSHLLGVHSVSSLGIPLDAETYALHTKFLRAGVVSSLNPDVQKATAKIQQQMNFDPANYKPLAIGKPYYEFLQQFDKVTDSGALREPAVQKVVEHLMSQLISIQTNVGITAIAVAAPQKEYKGFFPGDFQALQASSLSHKKSKSICQTGGGEDTGVSCPNAR